MQIFDSIAGMGHEQVVLCHDPAANYRGIIAIHSTILGPALGGTRFWTYGNDEEAIIDALRLARGMTYKNAVAGLNLGGGKSVIIGDNKKVDREMIFRAHGRFVESLGGRYITAEDVGTSTADMDFVHMETDYVTGLAGRSGDPSPVTAHGVFRAIQAAAKWCWGSDDLHGKTVSVQGCGHVGYHLAKELHQSGAKLVVTDIDPERVKRVVSEFAATPIGADDIYSVRADIFARSEEHTSELQSLAYLVCRLLLEKKKKEDELASFERQLMDVIVPGEAAMVTVKAHPGFDDE